MTDQSEHLIQRESVQWIRQYTPYLVYAIPNGGKRGRLEAMRLQAEEAAAALDAAATAASRRALGLEAQMKARDRESEALQRAVEELKGAEYQALSARMNGEEAARWALGGQMEGGCTCSGEMNG